jgi:hypothetical protein
MAAALARYSWRATVLVTEPRRLRVGNDRPTVGVEPVTEPLNAL